MATVEIDIKGINRISNALRTLAALNKSVLDPEMRAWAQSVRNLLKSKPYPAAPANSTYRRTGRLANSWLAAKHGTGVWGIRNSAPYSGFVVGDRQSWQHVGRWWMARPTIEGEIPKLTKALSDKVEKIWSNGG
jgi:hypothetical protein